LQAIERIETALTLVGEASCPTSAYLIERALDHIVPVRGLTRSTMHRQRIEGRSHWNDEIPGIFASA